MICEFLAERFLFGIVLPSVINNYVAFYRVFRCANFLAGSWVFCVDPESADQSEREDDRYAPSSSYR